MKTTVKRFELMEGESIILQSPKHWRNYIMLTLALIACVVATALRVTHPDISLVNTITGMETIAPGTVRTISYVEAFTALLLLGGIILSIIDVAYTCYYVTDRRIVCTSGWINVRTSEMMISKCETVSMSQDIPERIFSSGDILCTSAGTSMYLDDVYQARQFRQTVLKQINKQENQ